MQKHMEQGYIHISFGVSASWSSSQDSLPAIHSFPSLYHSPRQCSKYSGMFTELLWLNHSGELVHVNILLISWLNYLYSKHIYCAISQSGQTTLEFFFDWTEGMCWIVTRSCWGNLKKLLKSAFQPKRIRENRTLTQQVSSSALQRWRSTDLHFEKAAVKISQALAECKRGGIRQHLIKLRSTEIQNTIQSSIWPLLQNTG